MEQQTISKQRIADHGEVFTSEREVNAMLDLVEQETKRIDSRFLEPACGTGNFLTEILKRKLRVIEKKYKRSQLEYERYAVMAVSSIYGIDILEDNVKMCRQRLAGFFNETYTGIYKKKARIDCVRAVQFILSKNIVHGDALSLKTVGEHPTPITFSEWTFHGSMIKRLEYIFEELIPPGDLEHGQNEMFKNNANIVVSDLGEKHFDPQETGSYPAIHFLKIAEEPKV